MISHNKITQRYRHYDIDPKANQTNINSFPNWSLRMGENMAIKLRPDNVLDNLSPIQFLNRHNNIKKNSLTSVLIVARTQFFNILKSIYDYRLYQ